MEYKAFKDLKSINAKLVALFEEVKNTGESLSNHLRHHDAVTIALIGVIGILSSTVLLLLLK